MDTPEKDVNLSVQLKEPSLSVNVYLGFYQTMTQTIQCVICLAVIAMTKSCLMRRNTKNANALRIVKKQF